MSLHLLFKSSAYLWRLLQFYFSISF